ncbi:MAG: DUF975 family protein [Clostridia bacterium]|nr:DUF975 family protein [Clostridia bacterium]
MWERSELKEWGKRAFFRNFWAAVAVCFLLAFIGAEYAGSVEFIHHNEENSSNYQLVRDAVTGVLELRETGEGAPPWWERAGAILFNAFTSSQNWIFKLLAGGLFVAGSLLMLLFTFGVCHPVMVGVRHFFLHNRVERASPLEIMEVFHRDRFGHVVLVMFFRWLFLWLWTLLLVVPGIIKAYEYRMIPYLLADNPRLSRRRVFDLSREMMAGQKWRTFVLDLSFLLWNILSALTMGLVGIFFVNPYIAATDAELYTVLKRDAISRGAASPVELPMP